VQPWWLASRPAGSVDLTARGVEYPPAAQEELEAAAQVRSDDLEADRLFWSYWGTPLFNGMLNAEAVLDASL
jgi:hypothetical protein